MTGIIQEPHNEEENNDDIVLTDYLVAEAIAESLRGDGANLEFGILSKLRSIHPSDLWRMRYAVERDNTNKYREIFVGYIDTVIAGYLDDTTLFARVPSNSVEDYLAKVLPVYKTVGEALEELEEKLKLAATQKLRQSWAGALQGSRSPLQAE